MRGDRILDSGLLSSSATGIRQTPLRPGARMPEMLNLYGSETQLQRVFHGSVDEQSRLSDWDPFVPFQRGVRYSHTSMPLFAHAFPISYDQVQLRLFHSAGPT